MRNGVREGGYGTAGHPHIARYCTRRSAASVAVVVPAPSRAQDRSARWLRRLADEELEPNPRKESAEGSAKLGCWSRS